MVNSASALDGVVVLGERTGQGRHVEVAMQDAIVPTLTLNFAGLLESDGDFPERTGNRHGGVVHDPVLRDRGMLAAIGDGDRACTVLGSPLHLADSPVPPTWPAPLLGEHTTEVLRDRLDLSDEEIGQLAAAGVI